MGFQHKHTADLVRIASAGGGFRLEAAARHTADLVQIAAAAGGRARITFAGMSTRSNEDLVMIAAAGKGSVTFED